jgi:hypothetical protein
VGSTSDVYAFLAKDVTKAKGTFFETSMRSTGRNNTITTKASISGRQDPLVPCVDASMIHL